MSELIASVLIVLFPIVSTVGMISNIIALLIFSRKRFQNTIFCVYFRFNIVLDTYVIFNACIDFINYQFDINVESFSAIICHSRQYSVYALAAIAAWLNVSVTFNRMLDVLVPTKFTWRRLPRVQLAVCLFWMTLHLSMYSPIALQFAQYGYLNSTSSENGDADNAQANTSSAPLNTSNDSFKAATYLTCQVNFEDWLIWFDLFNATVFPFIVMTAFIVTTLAYLFRRSKLVTAASIPLARRMAGRHMRYGLVLTIIDVTFLVFNLPLCLANFVIDPSSSTTSGILAYTTNLIWYMNYGLAFFVNYSVNSLFKLELDDMCAQICKQLRRIFNFSSSK